ncbi:HD domain-containing phosphohydrolase [Acetobacterium woodii]|uniref:Diguanylate cyclase and metal dependent phosphohydrolase n=1 Tax=Acetobacterium woodii (strain ATCC 29683 / DSM 1030 / JCM 2381 / KCTC 1655 / WB1) TaxID=931626 RepID=H6LJ15_ACEWD|nr:HD domain-containing phosphohydrolase [Acetobacterium woodii]AFA47378.1 diguanylate cyclase and metal dependent phosphohydrolase [Acetobacterium woodii DSM 1030]
MNIQNVLLNLIVFTLPVIAGGYIFVGIKLLKQKVDGHYNYFSAIMFFSAVYALGYFLSLNSLTIETMIVARNFENLGVIAIPSCGIVYVSQLLNRKLSHKIKYLLGAVSGTLWVIYITNPLHHWAFSQIDLVKINGFAVAATTKGPGYYLIPAYYAIFLIYTSIELLKAIKTTNYEQLKRSYLFYFLTVQTSWIAVIIILTGLDKYLDPTPIVILLLLLIFGYCEVKNMLFRLEIDRWKRNFIKIEEIAFLVNEYNEIVCLNNSASIFFAGKKESVHEILKILDHDDHKRKPMKIPIDNDAHWFYVNINDFDIKRKLTSYMLVDFTEHHQAEAALRESEEKHRLLITQMAQGLAVHEIILDEARKIVDFRYLDANDSYERLTGHKSQDIVGKTALQVNPQMDKAWIQKYGQVAVTGQPIHFDFYDRNVDKYFDIVAYSPRFKQFAVIISDMTERKKAEQEIRYLSYHDYLTGLYNRRFYEEELERLDIPENLPITLIMADVNGLKLINDSFGHLKGDELLKKAASLICEGAPEGSVIARLGGDEFIVISPQTDIFEAVEVINNMKLKTLNERIDAFDVSISFGYEVKESEDQDIQEIYKRAEDDMYKHKLYESASIKNKTIELIMNTLYEKSGREMRHSRRVSELCKSIAVAMGLTKDAVNQIGAAGLMHDIGKMGIDEKILNKEGPLNFEEWLEIKRHPEIGYRILSSSNEFSELAKYVYEHHERWDGKGYPKKLKGPEISIQARIIGVADSYDAMTCDRSYRKGLNQRAAISELRKYAGQQFDPEVTQIFIENVLMKEN